MNQDDIIPGRLWRSKHDRSPRTVLVLAVRTSEENQRALGGFDQQLSAGQVVIAEAIDGDWKTIGPWITVPINDFLSDERGYLPFPRKGRDIRLIPGTASDARTRYARSEEALRLAGGARRSVRLSKAAEDALEYIGGVMEEETGKRPDDTETINRVLVEEEARLRKARRGPKR